jgi:mono/diheme cytochrome c family protein
MGILAVLPRNAFRKVVCALGVLVLTVLMGGSGFLLYAALADDERYAKQEEGKHHEDHASPQEKEKATELVKDADEAKKLAEIKKRQDEDRKIAAFRTQVKDQPYHQESVLPRQVFDYAREELQKKLDQQTRDQMLAHVKKQEEVEKFHQELKEAKHTAERAVFQASRGIPAEGPLTLVRNDPMTRGRNLFATNCAGCHAYTNPKTNKLEFPAPRGGFTASDLGGFGGKEWVLGLLENPGHDRYFGSVNRGIREKNKSIKEEDKQFDELTGMIGWANRPKKALEKQDALEKQWKAKLNDPEQMEEAQARLKKIAEKRKEIEEDLKSLKEDLPVIAAWLAKQPTAEPPKDDKDESEFARGFRAFEARCMECHPYGGTKVAPDLKGYGSPQWVRLMVMDPTHPGRYPGFRNSMPAFRNLEGPGASVYEEEFKLLHKDHRPDIIPLSDIERELILRFMRQDDRVIFGGRPITGPPQKHQ